MIIFWSLILLGSAQWALPGMGLPGMSIPRLGFGKQGMSSLLGMDRFLPRPAQSSPLQAQLLANPQTYVGNPFQAQQMSQILPLLLFNRDEKSEMGGKSNMLMMMMMQNPSMMSNPMAMAPLLMDSNGESDLKSVFTALTMMQNGCMSPQDQMKTLMQILKENKKQVSV